MKTHDLKIWPEYFIHILNGSKKHEIRKNDRNYEVNDILILNEYNNISSTYTGRKKEYRVTYISSKIGVHNGWCIMSIEPVKEGK